MPIPYEDPTVEYVTEMLTLGVTDPEMITRTQNWTDKEKAAFSSKFTSLLEGAQKEKDRRERVWLKAYDIKDKTPILRDIPEGFEQGFYGLGAGLTRLGGQDQEADTMIRQIQESEEAHALADTYDPVPDFLQRGVRGATRSITEMAPGAALAGPYGAIGSASFLAGNRAITEARDAGLEGSQFYTYIGAQAGFEALYASIFQGLGKGGLEAMLGRGVTRSGGRAALKQAAVATGHEIPEELLTEFSQALNEKLHGVDPTEWSWEQARRIFVDTLTQTTLATGAISSFSSVAGQEGLKQREEYAENIGLMFGLDKASALRAMDRAVGKKDFEAALGEEIMHERALTTEGLAEWMHGSVENMAAARELAGKRSPSRKEWERAGLPKRDRKERRRVADELRELLEVLPEVAPEGAPVEPEVTPPVEPAPEPVPEPEAPPEPPEPIPEPVEPPAEPPVVEHEPPPAPPEPEVAPEPEPPTEEPTEPEGPVEEPTEPQKKGSLENLSTRIAESIDMEDFSREKLFELADDEFGGTRAQGAYKEADVYDAMELGMNISAMGSLGTQFLEEEDPREYIKRVGDLGRYLPSQTSRTEERSDLQQFSTPPSLAGLAAWVSNINSSDTIVEPSAGTGNILNRLLDFDHGPIYANEISDRRHALLKQFQSSFPEENIKGVTKEDADHLDAIYRSKGIRPTAVVMNPPFSRNVRIKGKKKIGVGLKHVLEAVKLVEDGGRVVAILGGGQNNAGPEGGASLERPGYRKLWNDIQKAGGVVRANIRIPGEVYKKFGTAFPTRLAVIDKNPADAGEGRPITGEVKSLDEALNKLMEVYNARERRTPSTGEPGVEGPQEDEATETGPELEPEPGPEPTVEPPVSEPGEPGTTGEPPVQPPGGATEPGPRGPRPPRPEGTPIREPGGEPEPEGPGARPPGKRPQRPDKPRPDVPDTTRSEDESVTGTRVEKKGIIEEDGPFSVHQPTYIPEGGKEHPAPLAESAVMATIELPKVDYQPNLPRDVIESGEISIPQYEPIVLAGAAWEQHMPNGYRRGFMTGDGTGVGKTREILGAILDNYRQGRKKAVIFTPSKDLFEDIKDVAEKFGHGLPAELFQLKGDKITRDTGILVMTYASLTRPSQNKKDKTPVLKQDIIAEWLGDDWDGVLTFDEAHKMGNALPKSVSGIEPSKTGVIGWALQEKLKEARVLYASATGATAIDNLAYGHRLGLWGEGTSFADRNAALSSLHKGGIAVMEVVAQNLKRKGSYVARSISMAGVGFDTLNHDLTEDQTETYNKLANAWKIVIDSIEGYIGSQNLTGHARSNITKQLYGTIVRFFNNTLSSLKMPSLFKAIDASLEAGHSPVIQIVGTGASALKSFMAGSPTTDEIQSVQLSPMNILMGYLEDHFPTQMYEESMDDDGHVTMVPVFDADGKAVHDPHALAEKERLLDELAMLPAPQLALDQIIAKYGTENVAEVTSRKERLVVDPKTGRKKHETGRKNQDRAAEIAEFMDDKRRILIFSKAGGTGFSYHADLAKKNQRIRDHFVLEAGWSADEAIQMLGRTHRSNQKQPPRVFLVTTSLPGEKRFISTIARRLQQLGALTKGSKEASGQELYSESDNLETPYASPAFHSYLREIDAGGVLGLTLDQFEEKTGLAVQYPEEKGGGLKGVSALPPLKTFLNRVLALTVADQSLLFNGFMRHYDIMVEGAKQRGEFDQGTEAIKHHGAKILEEHTVTTDETSGAETKYIKIEAKQPNKKVPWAKLEQNAKDREADQVVVYVNKKSGKTWGYMGESTKTHLDGRVTTEADLISTTGNYQSLQPWKLPGTQHSVPEQSNWEKFEGKEAEKIWNDALSDVADYSDKIVHMISGDLLSVWDRIEGKPEIRRLTLDDGRGVLGRHVKASDIKGTLNNLGANVTHDLTPAQAVPFILEQNGEIILANGWGLHMARVRNEYRIELFESRNNAASLSQWGKQLKEYGVMFERLGYMGRWFIPVGDQAVEIMERLLKNQTIVESSLPEERGMAAEGEEEFTGDVYMPAQQKYIGPEAGSVTPEKPRGPEPEKEKPKRPISKADVILLIKKLWPELSIRGKGTYRRPSVLGWYTWKLAEMRLKNPRDLDTALHEIGHHFDRQMKGWSVSKGLPRGIPTELIALGKALYGEKKPKGGYRREGFAEFIREYITGSPDIQGKAPKLYGWFTTTYLQAKPKEAKKLRDLELKMMQLAAQSPDENFEAFMAAPKADWSPERIAAATASLERKHINKGLPLLRIMQKAQVTDVKPSEHPFMLYTAYTRSATGRTLWAAMHATHSLAGDKTGEGLRQALDPLADRGQEIIDQWKKYAVARRALDLYERGIQPGVSQSDAQAIVDKYDSEEFRQVLDDVTDWSRRILYQLVEAGVMTEKEFGKIQDLNPVYVPFARRFIKGEKMKGVKLTRGAKGVHRIKGSEIEINDPLDMMILQAEKITQVAMQANVVRSLFKLVDKEKGNYLGQILSPMPNPMEAITFSAEQIKKDIAKKAAELGADPDKIATAMTDTWNEYMTIFRKVPAPRKGEKEKFAVTAIVDGNRRWAEINDEGVLEALDLLGRDEYIGGPLGKISRELVGLQRLGATGLNPAFGLIRNLLRDSLTASITADYHYHIPLYSTLVGTFKAIRGVESSELYHALGLDLSGRIKQDKRLRTRTGRAVTVKSPIKKFWYGGPISGIRDLLSLTEVGPRLMEFEGAMKHAAKQDGWTKADALILASCAAKDVTVNFTQAGSDGAKINEVVLFYNAGIQGINKLARSLGVAGAMPWQKNQTRGANLLKTAGHGAILTMASVLAYAFNKDKEKWKELPEYEKWNYLNLFWDDQPIARIPLPFEAGALFGSLPVAMLDGVDSFNEAIRQAFKNASPISLEGSDMEEVFHSAMRNIAAVAPIADVVANKDWKGDYIFNPQVAMGKELQDQYHPYTTGFSMIVANHFPMQGWISPAQLDHMLSGYTGGLYRRIANVFDTHTYNKLIGGLKTGDLSVIPVAGTLFPRHGSNRLTDKFYGDLKVLSQRKGSQRATLEEIGRLSAGNSLARKLGEDWDARREAKSKAEQEKILENIFAKIRVHNARTDFDKIGSYSVILAATDKEPTEIELGTARRLLPQDTTLRNLLRNAAKHRGWSTEARSSNLKLTSFGKRMARLKKLQTE